MPRASDAALGFKRMGADAIEVCVPISVVELVLTLASTVCESFAELSTRIDESVAFDDPLVCLERQMTIEATCATVLSTGAQHVLTDDQAEAWLKVLSMGLALSVARFGVTDDASVERLDEQQTALVSLLQMLQVILIDALDAEVHE